MKCFAVVLSLKVTLCEAIMGESFSASAQELTVQSPCHDGLSHALLTWLKAGRALTVAVQRRPTCLAFPLLLQ